MSPPGRPKGEYRKAQPEGTPVTAPAALHLDASSGAPLYQQLAQALTQAIRAGTYRPGQALPSERTLSDELGVSRVTARKAIERLVELGLVMRRRGSGNYIAPKLDQPLTRLTGFSEELRQRGFTPSSRWLSRQRVIASPEEQLTLGLAPGARVQRLARLRLADDVVMAYELTALPDGLLPEDEALAPSLYAQLAALGRAPVRGLQHIRAVNADAALARQLDVPDGQAVLHITRVGYLGSGQAVELTQSWCRSDYYGFVAEMRRETA